MSFYGLILYKPRALNSLMLVACIAFFHSASGGFWALILFVQVKSFLSVASFALWHLRITFPGVSALLGFRNFNPEIECGVQWSKHSWC